MKKYVISNNQKWLALTGVSVANFLGCVDFTIVNTALPAMQLGLKATVTQLQWIVNIFVLALSSFMVVMGRLADIYGRRRLFYSGTGLFALASLGAGLATDINSLIALRLLQGLGSAILYTSSGAIVAQAFPPHERGKAIGVLFGVSGLGLAVGPMLGGVLVSAFGWPWIFLINIPFIFISLAICWGNIAESYNHAHGTTLDWPGAITLVLALPCLILAITQGSEWGWFSLYTLSAFTGAVVLLGAFYVIETRSSSPIIQFHLFANRQFVMSAVATFMLAFFYCLAFFLMPLYLQNIRHETSYMTGLILLTTTATIAVLSPIAGRLVDSHGPKLLLVWGFVFFACSALLQAHFAAHSGWGIMLTAFILMGMGWACTLGPSTVSSLSSVPEGMGAIATGSSWTLHNIGGALGLALGVLVYRIYAKNALLADLAYYGLQPGAWSEAVVSNLDKSVQVLVAQAQLSVPQAVRLFEHFFIAGYQATMWLLLLGSLLTFIILCFGMKTHRS